MNCFTFCVVWEYFREEIDFFFARFLKKLKPRTFRVLKTTVLRIREVERNFHKLHCAETSTNLCGPQWHSTEFGRSNFVPRTVRL